MVEPEGDAADQPILQPRVVQFLRQRPRLIDDSFRKDFLGQLEVNISERRKPDTMAERTVQRLFQETQQAAEPAVKDRVNNKLRSANEGALERL